LAIRCRPISERLDRNVILLLIPSRLREENQDLPR
jgi:hypothetical protein